MMMGFGTKQCTGLLALLIIGVTISTFNTCLSNLKWTGILKEQRVFVEEFADSYLWSAAASSEQQMEIASTSTSTSTIDFDIIVITMNRVSSLKRLLDSIEAADYDGDSAVRLTIQVDFAQHDNDPVIALAESFVYSHGPKIVEVATANRGLRASWLEAWKREDGAESPHAIILEDDVEVSLVWYKWVKKAWDTYKGNDKIAGISLNRQTFVPDKKIKNFEIVNDHQPFLYKLVGSQGFSPHPTRWKEFLAFVATVEDLNTFAADVPGLITSDWYKKLPKRGMWTQLFIYFCNQHDLFNLYINLPERKTLSAHYREQGEHFHTTEGREFDLAKTVSYDFPLHPVQYDWDGTVVVQDKRATVPNQKSKPKLAGIKLSRKEPRLEFAGSEYGGWTYDLSMLTSDSIVYSVGLGEDTSWDEVILAKHGLQVWGMDPTPKSLRYVKARKELHTHRFHLVPEGLSTTRHMATFTMPENPEHVSMREGEHGNMGNTTVDVQVNTLENWMKGNNHTHLDILKIDIEGSEYDVIEDWIQRDFFPTDQLLVEWHFRWLEDKSRHDRVIQGLKDAGWYVAKSQNSGREQTFLRSPLPNSGSESDDAIDFTDSESKKLLVEAARVIRDKHDVVVIQLLNEGYLKMTTSWICNVRNFPGVLDKTLFIATDQAAYNMLTVWDESLNVVHVNYEATKNLSYGQYAYYKFMLFRTRLLLYLLESNLPLWLTESDAVWLRDPTAEVLSTQGDMIVMNDAVPPAKVLQGGFQLLRPTRNTINIWKKLLTQFDMTMKRAKAGSEMGDSGSEQLMMNKLIHTQPGLRFAWLDSAHFVPGLYYENAVYARTLVKPKVILNNYIIGNGAKMERAKKWGYWFVKDDGTCDDKASAEAVVLTAH